jgi:hypothetical protein
MCYKVISQRYYAATYISPIRNISPYKFLITHANYFNIREDLFCDTSILLMSNAHEFRSVKGKHLYTSPPDKIKFRALKCIKCMRNSLQTASAHLKFVPRNNNETCACLIICQRLVRCQGWQSEGVVSRFCGTGIHLETQPPEGRDRLGLSLTDRLSLCMHPTYGYIY